MPFPRSFYATSEDYRNSYWMRGGYNAAGSPSADTYYWGGPSGMINFPNLGLGARVGAQMPTIYTNCQINFTVIGGGYSPSMPLDSVHEQLFSIVLPDRDVEVEGLRMEKSLCPWVG